MTVGLKNALIQNVKTNQHIMTVGLKNALIQNVRTNPHIMTVAQRNVLIQNVRTNPHIMTVAQRNVLIPNVRTNPHIMTVALKSVPIPNVAQITMVIGRGLIKKEEKVLIESLQIIMSPAVMNVNLGVMIVVKKAMIKNQQAIPVKKVVTIVHLALIVQKAMIESLQAMVVTRKVMTVSRTLMITAKKVMIENQVQKEEVTINQRMISLTILKLLKLSSPRLLMKSA